MTIRTLFLASSASLAVLSAPAAAQYVPVEADTYVEPGTYASDVIGDERYETVVQSGTYRGEWEGEWRTPDSYTGRFDGTYTDLEGRVIDADYEGTWVDDTRFVSDDGLVLYRDGEFGWHEDAYRGDGAYRMIRRDLPRQPAPPAYAPHLAYTAAQRDQWLSQCRSLRGEMREGTYIAYEDESERRSSGILPSIITAVIGGVAGNRIAGSGDRLAGTLIGAGVGGLAGLALTALADGIANGDRDEEDLVYVEPNYSFDYCEAYLLNYERGYGTGSAEAAHVHGPDCGHAAVSYQPVMHQPAVRRRVIVREIDAPSAPPERRIHRVVAPPASKLVPLQ